MPLVPIIFRFSGDLLVNPQIMAHHLPFQLFDPVGGNGAALGHFIPHGGMQDQEHGQRGVVGAEGGVFEVRGIPVADQMDVMILLGPVGGDGNAAVRLLLFPDDMPAPDQRLDVQGIIGGSDRGEDGSVMHEIVHWGRYGGRVAAHQGFVYFPLSFAKSVVSQSALLRPNYAFDCRSEAKLR